MYPGVKGRRRPVDAENGNAGSCRVRANFEEQGLRFNGTILYVSSEEQMKILKNESLRQQEQFQAEKKGLLQWLLTSSSAEIQLGLKYWGH